jgi:hypothetical protein
VNMTSNHAYVERFEDGAIPITADFLRSLKDLENALWIDRTSREAAEMGMELKTLLESLANDTPESWHFRDRVLGNLRPQWFEIIVLFYEENGQTLEELISPEQLRSLDGELFKDLIEYIAEEQPLFAQALGIKTRNSLAR